MAFVESNIKEFTKGLDEFNASVEKELAAFLKKIAIDLHNKIVARTPLGSGFARASWNLSLNTPDESLPVKQTVTRNRQKGTAISEVRAKRTQARLNGIRPFADAIWINNSAPYILELEAGRSHEAPSGMALISLAELSASISGELL